MSPILLATLAIMASIANIAMVVVVSKHSATTRRALIKSLQRRPMEARQILIKAGVKEEELR